MTIAAILATKGHEVTTIEGGASVADAVAMLASRRIGALPVIDGDAVVGVFSERDVIYCLETAGAAALQKKVAEVMTSPAITVSPRDAVIAALSLITRRRVRHLPVVDDGRLVGFVSIGDLVKHRIDNVEREATAMREYIQGA